MISSNKICISNQWQYSKNKDDNKVVVNIPHTCEEVPYNYFDEKMYQFISYYENDITIKNSNKRIFLKFDGVMTAFTPSINGNKLEERRGGYIPHTVEITDYIKDGENKIFVEVDSTERTDIPPFGYIVDYLTFGGIYRDVWQYEVDNTFIRNLFFKYEVIEHNGKTGKVKCMPIVEIDSLNGEDIKVCYEVLGTKVETNISAEKGINRYNLEETIIESVELWSIKSPKMNICNTSLVGSTSNDGATIKVGFRDLKIVPEGVFINGEKIDLIGLNRHQSFPYVGYAMPKRAQEEDAIILKETLGLNTVRCSHYPQSTYFLDKCDEIGLLVLEEIPGWQHISKEEPWRKQVLDDVKGMIERDYNHPSILTWGVRINESGDDEELYTKTNKLAKELDDTRLTSGVRCYENSQLLEEIYTMNDFAHCGKDIVLRDRKTVTGLDYPVPYMITEFCGHIYPTKKFDCEQKLVEHALRHGRVQSKARLDDEILGAIGWCAFDYNTHFDFGSGDRICYHGVMDMFRMPKFAAYMYRSQKDVEDEIVLEPLTYWTRGEREIGIVFPIYVFTNCDSIELKLDGESKGVFKREEKNLDDKLSGLKNPPIVVNALNGEWGASWTDAEFIGYDKEGNVVASKKFAAHPVYKDIKTNITTNELYCDKVDTARISVEAIDQLGSIIPFINDSIDIEVTGDIEVIGPTRINLIGGSISFWVKSKVLNNKSEATIKIKSFYGHQKEIKINLV
ncbi:glycoside hydrolase family 2 TIM barrel-domain containing protein [uncultured Tyzzerella sp.]|uniref:glycoside hydrolase family 2 protein n=1 Tax=uncultured Tyzzerella sp. TaxID=2321398 RepID=UPI002942A7CE|nr:glycoside hydrolase family 2 TIM barrel-domain containing protein [uncultured Tyzzerella sp.]